MASNWLICRLFVLFIVLTGFTSCDTEKSQQPDWDKIFSSQGLEKVTAMDSSIMVDLRYSTKNNFIGKDLYGSLEEAYLRPEAAQKLVLASKILRETHPKLRLKIYDAARPRRIQQILWDKSGLSVEERPKYVANPETGSIHNYGFAVDLTIADTSGQELDMGTDYDDFSKTAHIDKEQDLINSGSLTQAQVQSRRLLRNVMTDAGFISLTTEWWHFDALPRKEVVNNYTIVE